MNPEEMGLAYVTPWRRLSLLLHLLGLVGRVQGGPMAVVAKAKDKEEDRQEEQAYLWTDEPPPDSTAGLMCPSHGKLCKKGICSGMSRLVKEEERQREVERGRWW